jgi:hypothetical protein
MIIRVAVMTDTSIWRQRRMGTSAWLVLTLPCPAGSCSRLAQRSAPVDLARAHRSAPPCWLALPRALLVHHVVPPPGSRVAPWLASAPSPPLELELVFTCSVECSKPLGERMNICEVRPLLFFHRFNFFYFLNLKIWLRVPVLKPGQPTTLF